MKTKSFITLLLVAIATLFITSCQQEKTNSNSNPADSLVVVKHIPELDSLVIVVRDIPELTGQEWAGRLLTKNYGLHGSRTMDALCSEEFTNAGKDSVEIVMLSMSKLEKRTTANILAEAERRGLKRPTADIACRFREQYSNQEIAEMGPFWIIFPSKPLKITEDCESSNISYDSVFLAVDRYANDPYENCLCCYEKNPHARGPENLGSYRYNSDQYYCEGEEEWPKNCCFAFIKAN